MKLTDYIRGQRKGKEARRIELEAMNDPFLRDALEGFELAEGDPGEALERLSGRLGSRMRSARAHDRMRARRRPVLYRPVVWTSAAALLVCLTLSGLLYRYYIIPSVTYNDLAVTSLSDIPEAEMPPIVTKEYHELSEEVDDFSEVPAMPEPAPPAVTDILNIVADDVRITTELSFADFDEDAIVVAPLKAEEVEGLEEFLSRDGEESVIVVGARSNRRSRVTGSISEIDASRIAEQAASIPNNKSLQGRVAGASVGSDGTVNAGDGMSLFAGGAVLDRAERAPYPTGDSFMPVESNPSSQVPLSMGSGSYSRLRNAIGEGRLPDAGSIRVEELVNSFAYTAVTPSGRDAVGVGYEAGPCPWNPDHKLVLISVRAKNMAPDENGAVPVVAENVMVSAEFDPAVVRSYRLIGFTRGGQDGQDSSGASMRAGQGVTVMYEVVPVDGTSRDLFTIDISYHDPSKKKENNRTVTVREKRGEPSGDFRFASAVALFGEILIRSPYVGLAGYDTVIENGEMGLANDPNGARVAFIELVRQAKKTGQ